MSDPARLQRPLAQGPDSKEDSRHAPPELRLDRGSLMAGKRSNGEGSVYRDSRGLWRAAITLPDGRRRYVSAKTKALCVSKLQKLQTDISIGRPTGSGERLGPFLSWWLGTLEAKAASDARSPNTVDNARWAVNRWITPELGSKRLRELLPEDVERLLAKMAKAGKSRSSVNRVRTYLGQALEVAERRGKVVRNVARLAEMPATDPPATRRSLTEEQAARLLAVAAGDRLAALYVIGLTLGLRPGELTGLAWDDVDLKARTIRVVQSLKNERGKLRTGDTKTARSRRTLRLPAKVETVLRTHKRLQAEERLAAGSAWVDSGLVFTSAIGTPLDPSNLRDEFDRLTSREGLGHWTPNELRHSAASLLSAAGVPLEEIADMLGHASTRMLEKHYRHRVRPTVDAHIAVMDKLLG